MFFTKSSLFVLQRALKHSGMCPQANYKLPKKLDSKGALRRPVRGLLAFGNSGVLSVNSRTWYLSMCVNSAFLPKNQPFTEHLLTAVCAMHVRGQISKIQSHHQRPLRQGQRY